MISRHTRQVICLALTVVSLQLFSSEAIAGPGVQVVTPIPLTAAQSKAVVINDLTLLTNFTFERTIGQIITTSGKANTAAAREAFVQTLLDNYKISSAANAGIVMPVTVRPTESSLSPAALLNAQDALNGMRPVALTNRIDLTPADGTYCGEQRIVYVKGQGGDFSKRMTLIFEAAIDNPDPSKGAKGCQPIAQFWASLVETKSPPATTSSTVTTAVLKQTLQSRLEGFYYNGVVSSVQSIVPPVHFLHYGNPFGQVRINAFVNDFTTGQSVEWMLREFRVDSNSTQIKFATQTVNNSPWRNVYQSNTTVDTRTFALRRSACQKDLIANNSIQVFNPDLKAVSAGVPLTDLKLISDLGVAISPACNGFESNSQNPSGITAPPSNAFEGNINLQSGVADAVNTRLSTLPYKLSIGTDMVMNRINTQSCAGCHQFSVGSTIAPSSTNGFVTWPSSLGFVHINEFGTLSPAMTNNFLPARFASLQQFLTAVATMSDTSAVSSAPASVSAISSLQQQIVTGSISDSDRAAQIDSLRSSDKAKPGALVSIRPTH